MADNRRTAGNGGDMSGTKARQRDISTSQMVFPDREHLVESLRSALETCDGKTVLFAGHYMLIYRRETHRLAPLLRSVASHDPEAGELEREYSEVIGDFPEASFEIALRLLLSRRDCDRRIALLVNDYQFKTFQPAIPSGDALARLKYEYYRSEDALPRPFSALLSRYACAAEWVFERNNARRSTENTLPSRTYFFSENVLRNRFGKVRRNWVLSQPGFRWKGTIYGGMKLVYTPSLSARPVCLVDNREGCGCSGAMIELLLQLWEHGAKNLILFIPDECRGPVAEALEATLRALVPFRMVIAVWSDGVGVNGEALFRNATRYDLRV